MVILLRIFLTVFVLWAHETDVDASVVGDVARLDPLEVAHTFGLSPPAAIASLETTEVQDLCPTPSGKPRIPKARYFPVTSQWQSAEEIAYAEYCYSAACQLFVHSRGSNTAELNGALRFAHAAFYYGHPGAAHLMMGYYRRNISIPRGVIVGRDCGQHVICAGDPEWELVEVVKRTKSGVGGSRPPSVAYGFNAAHLKKGEVLCTGDLGDQIGRVFRDLFAREAEEEARASAEISAEEEGAAAAAIGVGDVAVGVEEAKEEKETFPLLGLRHRRFSHK